MNHTNTPLNPPTSSGHASRMVKEAPVLPLGFGEACSENVGELEGVTAPVRPLGFGEACSENVGELEGVAQSLKGEEKDGI